MKRIFFFILLLPALLFAQDADHFGPLEVPTDADMFGPLEIGTDCSHFGPLELPTSAFELIFNETYETSEYDNSACGSAPCITQKISPDPNGDMSTAGLDMVGTYCLSMDVTSYLDLDYVDQSLTTVYVLGKFRFEDGLENNEEIIRFYNTNGDYLRVYILSDSNSNYFQAFGDGYSSSTATNCPVDTSTWIKMSVAEGAVNDSVCVATWNGGSWDSYVCDTRTTFGYDYSKIRLENLQDSAGVEYQYWDNTKVSLSDFTADPSTY